MDSANRDSAGRETLREIRRACPHEDAQLADAEISGRAAAAVRQLPPLPAPAVAKVFLAVLEQAAPPEEPWRDQLARALEARRRRDSAGE